MTVPLGTRRVEIAAMARDRMTAEQNAEVKRTCRDRGFRLNLRYVGQRRTYVASLVVGSTGYEGADAHPYEAWRKALALRDGPVIVSLLTPDNAA